MTKRRIEFDLYQGRDTSLTRARMVENSTRISPGNRFGLLRDLGRFSRWWRARAACNAGLQSRHKVDDVAWGSLFRSCDRQTFLLLARAPAAPLHSDLRTCRA